MTVRNGLYAAFCVICLLALIWPGYAMFGNRVEPLVLGLPFSLFWNVLWVQLSFAAIIAYHVTRPKRGH